MTVIKVRKMVAAHAAMDRSTPDKSDQAFAAMRTVFGRKDASAFSRVYEAMGCDYKKLIEHYC